MTVRRYTATTEVQGPLGDQVRLYTRDMPRPKDALLSVNEAEESGNAGAMLTYTEALRLVNGLIEYFEMTDFDAVLPREFDEDTPAEYVHDGQVLRGRDIVELSTVVDVPRGIVARARKDDPGT